MGSCQEKKNNKIYNHNAKQKIRLKYVKHRCAFLFHDFSVEQTENCKLQLMFSNYVVLAPCLESHECRKYAFIIGIGDIMHSHNMHTAT